MEPPQLPRSYFHTHAGTAEDEISYRDCLGSESKWRINKHPQTDCCSLAGLLFQTNYPNLQDAPINFSYFGERSSYALHIPPAPSVAK